MKLRLLLTLVGLVNAPQALANWYEIEMLVFSRQPDAGLKENFKAPTQALQSGKALDLIAPSFQPRVMDLIKAIPACVTSSTATTTQDVATTPAPLSATQLQALQQLLAPAPVPTAADSQITDNLASDSMTSGNSPAEQTAEATSSPEQFNPQNCQMEQWTEDGQLLSRPLNSTELALQLPAPTQIPAELAGTGVHQGSPYLLSLDQLSLKNIAWQIKQDASKQLLLHTAWRQPLTGNRQRSHWYAGQYFAPATGEAASIETPQLMQQVQQQLQALEQGQSAMQQWFSPWQLDSLVSFRAGRFILFDGSFYLRQANDALPAQIEIKQQARLTLGQLNYLDHPRLGVIIQVKRYDPATAVATN